jgi:FkbM family methyltransferase
MFSMRVHSASLHRTFDDYLKLIVPSRLYYPHKVAKSTRGAEPELAILRDIVPAGCTAIDIGANRGVYSYVISHFAGQVEAFEPYPVLARVIRAKLSPKVRVHEVALSNCDGTAIFYIPRSERGVDMRVGGSLDNVNAGMTIAELEVRVAMLDSFEFKNVGFIKIDAEGAEMKIVAGAQRTIPRNRPNLLVELIAPYHDTVGEIEHIESMFGYDAWIVVGKQRGTSCAQRHVGCGEPVTCCSR